MTVLALTQAGTGIQLKVDPFNLPLALRLAVVPLAVHYYKMHAVALALARPPPSLRLIRVIQVLL